ncbi:hypothetical protein [Streptomyces roseicoloratus]|uniref:hypothetical protein n=1 Tax=Streptomyces roseicoloratus TaxID=2508722 RepID=UPI001FE710F5|nr:hypothetical protein [Streptomyces roseicoloratus]
MTVEGTEIVVRLGPREALAARRRTIRLPVSALRAVGVENSWWRVLRGEAARGVWLPGRCVGERHGPPGTDFVAVRAETPALQMDLGPASRYARVAVSVPDPEQTERALRPYLPEDAVEPAEAEEPDKPDTP